MSGTDRRSVSNKAGKSGKASSAQVESGGGNISQQLQEINSKLNKLDELEKLNKELLGNLLKLSRRVDAVTAENRLLKREIEDLKQANLQEEVLIKGFKLEQPQQHLEVFKGVCERAGLKDPVDVKEVRPLVFKNNKRTDAVVVKFWKVQDKARFIGCIRGLKKPITPRDINIRSQNKFILVQDHLTSEKQKIHSRTWDLCKLGLQRPWFYKGSTWITHPKSDKRFRVADVGDIEDIEFVLVTQGNVTRENPSVPPLDSKLKSAPQESTTLCKVTDSEH